jgi:hypothetical protein
MVVTRMARKMALRFDGIPAWIFIGVTYQLDGYQSISTARLVSAEPFHTYLSISR